jgi:hypothetical protein
MCNGIKCCCSNAIGSLHPCKESKHILVIHNKSPDFAHILENYCLWKSDMSWESRSHTHTCWWLQLPWWKNLFPILMFLLICEKNWIVSPLCDELGFLWNYWIILSHTRKPLRKSSPKQWQEG